MGKKKFLKYAFIILGLYTAYFITGVILTETDTVDEWWIFPNTVLEDREKQNPPAGTDGPHIFYKDSLIIVKSVMKNGTGYVGITDTFYNKDSVLVQCRFDTHPEWNFTTRLKDSLANEPCTYAESDSLIAISDIEGEFGAFRSLLIANHVMNARYEWTFGTGHLVLVGDFFDRGVNVTETLWLIYHLEQEAEKTGGKVHFILGNHELMNMCDDLRYVSSKYINNTYRVKANYKTWFKPGTELGNWLATKNIIEKVGSTLFVHGGISQDVNQLNLSIEEMNSACRPHYFVSNVAYKARLNEKLKLLLTDSESPLWYRGYVQGTATQKQVNMTLNMYKAQRIVVGHTKVVHVTSFYAGKVIAIDTRHAQGISQGIFYSKSKFYWIDKTGLRYGL